MSSVFSTSFSPSSAVLPSSASSQAVAMDTTDIDKDVDIVAPRAPTKFKGLYKQTFKYEEGDSFAYRSYLEWRTDARANWKEIKRYKLQQKIFIEQRNNHLAHFLKRTKEQVGVVLDIARPRRGVVSDFQELCTKLNICFQKAITDDSSSLRVVKNSLMKIIGPQIRNLVDKYQR